LPLTLNELGSICDQEPGVCFSIGQNGTDEPAKCFCLNALGETAIKERHELVTRKAIKGTNTKHLKIGKCMIQQIQQEKSKEITNIFIYSFVFTCCKHGMTNKISSTASKQGIFTFTTSQLS